MDMSLIKSEWKQEKEYMSSREEPMASPKNKMHGTLLKWDANWNKEKSCGETPRGTDEK